MNIIFARASKAKNNLSLSWNSNPMILSLKTLQNKIKILEASQVYCFCNKLRISHNKHKKYAGNFICMAFFVGNLFYHQKIGACSLNPNP